MTGLLTEGAAQSTIDRRTTAVDQADVVASTGPAATRRGRADGGAEAGADGPRGDAARSGRSVVEDRTERGGRAGGARDGDEGVGARLERFRPELRVHCRRMLGSASEAEDAVQETIVRAWRSYQRFEGRSSLRSWLHRIATNVCFDMLKAPQRRARPTDPETAASAGAGAGAGADATDGVSGAAAAADPADRAMENEDVRLAFVAALLHLPPQQRSVLLLCEVLRWRASEAAELLGTSVASVNSALQRARATLAGLHGTEPGADRAAVLDDDQRALADRAAAAFDRYDVGSLVALLG